jgi:protein arginine N-methyltransferase 1
MKKRRLERVEGLRFALEADGRLRVEAALGADEVRIGPAVVPVLAAFGAPRAVDEAARELAGRDGAEGAARVLRAIEGLERAGLLVEAGPRARARAATSTGTSASRGPRAGILAEGAFADVEVHARMLADVRRAERFGAAIAQACRGRRVVEVGTGTGVLAVLAARAGARRVVAIEETPVAGIAREVVRRSGVAKVVTVVDGPARDAALAPAERGEVLVAELLGGDPLDEGILDAVADARERLLVAGARTIPRVLEVWAQGIEARDERLEAPRRLAALAEAERALGVDLGPVREALAARAPGTFTAEVRGLEPGGGARLLTARARLFRFDLERGPLDALRRAAQDVRAAASLPVEEAGRLGAVAVFFRAELAEGIELSNAPLAPETHWGQLVAPLARPRDVRPGDRVGIEARARRGELSIVEGDGGAADGA